MIRQAFPGTIRAVGPREFAFTLVTAQLARDGHVLLPSGMDLRDYKANPIILFQHCAEKPIARCTRIGLVDGEIRGAAEFPPEGTSPQADEVCNLVKNSIVNAMSCGFDIIEAEPLDAKKGTRGGLRILRSTLLEASIVSVPADTGARITERAYRSNAMSKHLARLEELVDTAARHHDDCSRAMDMGNDLAAERAHARLGRCLRDCQRYFRDIHAEAAMQDLKNNQFEQNSGGMGKGTSDSVSQGRAVPPTLRERLAEVLALARPFVPDGSAIGCSAVRELELARAQAHIKAVSAAGGFRRPPTLAERRLEVARLARTQ